jgi:hypothetical protein
MSTFLDTWSDAESCFAAVDPKTRNWEAGCGYSKASKIDKMTADRFIGKRSSIIEEDGPTVNKLPIDDDQNSHSDESPEII